MLSVDSNYAVYYYMPSDFKSFKTLEELKSDVFNYLTQIPEEFVEQCYYCSGTFDSTMAVLILKKAGLA